MYHRILPALSAAAGIVLSATMLLAPSPAEACGGFFCSRTPIDQAGEQILFAQQGDSIEAHVNIQYEGDAESFAWIVPTPSAPEVGVSTPEMFQQLEWRAKVSFQLEWSGDQNCFWQAFPESADGSTNDDGAGGGVTVVQQSSVGAYEFAVLQATSTEALFEWLGANDYDIPDNVMPYIEPYVLAGGDIHFVAFRLQSDRGVGDLSPVRLKYISSKPMVPIQLTAIATQPDLGVTVHVLSDVRAVPENYLHVHLNEARIDWLTGGSNYEEVLSLAMNEAGGQGFHTEYAGPSNIMQETLFVEGWYDTNALSTIQDPVAFVDAMMNQSFRGDSQLMAMFMRYIPFPAALETQGVEPNQFYNNLEEYREFIDVEMFDPAAFAAELEETIVAPRQHAQELFDNIPYLTRMYTTLSAEEMSRDPVFAYNADMPDVDRVRRAVVDSAECESGDGNGTITITLSNGSQFTSNITNNYQLELDDSQPAAGLVEETSGSGAPTVIFDTVKGIDDLEAVVNERQRENHEARPDMVSPPSITGDANRAGGGDSSGCSVSPASSTTSLGALVLLALGLLVLRRR